MPESRAQPSWMLVLCYLAFLGFIPLLAGKHDSGVRWHAMNGLLLFAAVVVVGAVATVIGILVPSLFWVYAFAMFIALILYTLIAILAVVKALGGERLIVPVISKYADRLA